MQVWQDARARLGKREYRSLATGLGRKAVSSPPGRGATLYKPTCILPAGRRPGLDWGGWFTASPLALRQDCQDEVPPTWMLLRNLVPRGLMSVTAVLWLRLLDGGWAIGAVVPQWALYAPV